MVPDEIRRKRDELAKVPSRYVNWCDDRDLDDHSREPALAATLTRSAGTSSAARAAATG